MKSGYLSHRCTIGENTYSRHIIYIYSNKTLCSIEPFYNETPHTIFCDGWLISLAPAIETELSLFTDTLQHQFLDNPTLTIAEALNENWLFAKHRASIGDACCIYAISRVDWNSMRPTTVASLQLRKVV